MGQPTDPEFPENETITLYLDNDDTLECLVVCKFEVDDRRYVALLPLNAEGEVDDDAQTYLYRFDEPEEGEIVVENILDDEEFEIVSDYNDEILDEEEFKEVFGE